MIKKIMMGLALISTTASADVNNLISDYQEITNIAIEAANDAEWFRVEALSAWNYATEQETKVADLQAQLNAANAKLAQANKIVQRVENLMNGYSSTVSMNYGDEYTMTINGKDYDASRIESIYVSASGFKGGVGQSSSDFILRDKDVANLKETLDNIMEEFMESLRDNILE